MAKIRLPNGRTVTAPDDLAKEQYDEIVEDAMAKSSQPGFLERIVKSPQTLPTLGGIVGGTLGLGAAPFTGPAGPIAGAALGAGLGRAAGSGYQQIREALQGKIQPSTGAAAKAIGKEALLGAGAELAGYPIARGIQVGAPALGRVIQGQVLPSLLSTGTGAPFKAAQRVVTAIPGIMTAKNMAEETIQKILSKTRSSLESSKSIAGEAVKDTVDSIADKLEGTRVQAKIFGGGTQDFIAHLKKWKYLQTPEIENFAKQILEPMDFRDAYSLKRTMSDFASSVAGPTKAMAVKAIKILDDAMQATEQAALGTNFFAKSNKVFSKRAKINEIIEKNILGKAPKEIDEISKQAFEVASVKKAKAIFTGKEQGAMRLAERVEKLLPEEQQFLKTMKDTLAAREFGKFAGPLARTGLTGVALGGISYLDPRALALAPFLSPRLGAAYARGLGKVATGAGQTIGTTLPPAARTLFQSGTRGSIFGGQQ